MKKRILSTLTFVTLIAVAAWVFAADHIEAPAVKSTQADITDYYAFESPADQNNMVFVCNLLGFLTPGNVPSFDENAMVEFNIDNNGDLVEDLVIQCTFTGGKLQVYGPVKPTQTGLSSTLVNAQGPSLTADINQTGTANGMKAFAGVRDDPFFMDFTRFTQIADSLVQAAGGGQGPQRGFNSPGSDAFAGTNVLSVVVEVPKSTLGGTALNTWVTTNQKN